VKSVFAAPGVVPVDFEHWMFLPGSLFVIVSPKLMFPASTREWFTNQSFTVLRFKLIAVLWGFTLLLS
jgi:hypothetical protein